MEENKNSDNVQNKSAEQRKAYINNVSLNLIDKNKGHNNSSKK